MVMQNGRGRSIPIILLFYQNHYLLPLKEYKRIQFANIGHRRDSLEPLEFRCALSNFCFQSRPPTEVQKKTSVYTLSSLNSFWMGQLMHHLEMDLVWRGRNRRFDFLTKMFRVISPISPSLFRFGRLSSTEFFPNPRENPVKIVCGFPRNRYNVSLCVSSLLPNWTEFERELNGRCHTFYQTPLYILVVVSIEGT